MGILIMIGQVLLGLSILIVLHEAGHFFAARAFGVKVEKFYLFFDAWGVKLFKFNYKGCEYGIGWLPLGGYVKIAGMIDESMDTEQLKGEPQPWEFRSKPAWQRLIIMLAGIIVNVVLGILIFWMLTFKYGESYIDNTQLVDGVAPGIVGKELGIEPGDRIIAVGGEKIVRFSDLTSPKVIMGDTDLTIVRNGETKTLYVPTDILNRVSDFDKNEIVEPRVPIGKLTLIGAGSPAEAAGLQVGDSLLAINGATFRYFDEFKDSLMANVNQEVSIQALRDTAHLTVRATVSAEATLGFGHSGALSLPIERTTYTLGEAFPIGAGRAWSAVADNARGFGKIFKGEVRADKALAGPGQIAKMFGTEVDWIRFWTLVGLLSMILAFMNLLPIPALDGGHVMFLLIEMVQGKPLSDKFLETAQIIGFFIIVALMVFVLGNDAVKLISK